MLLSGCERFASSSGGPHSFVLHSGAVRRESKLKDLHGMMGRNSTNNIRLVLFH